MNYLQEVGQGIATLIQQDQYKNINRAIYAYGALHILKHAFNTSKFIYSTFLRSSVNLVKRYGKGTWVLITGSTDGIGKEFALQLSQQGFNIILVARNAQKLQNVAEEIKQKFLEKNKQSQIQVKTVQTDFSKSQQSGFFENIYEQVKDLDISFLINNVGMDIFKPFQEVTDQEIHDLININVLPVTFLTKQLIPKFMERKKQGKKSGILNVASFGGVIPCPYFTVYSATKAFNIIFSKSLYAEYPELDIMILNPSEVSTNMTYNRDPDIVTVTADSCARQTLGDMIHEEETDGHWSHKLQNSLSRNVPYPIFRYVLKNVLAPEWFKQREEGDKMRKQQQQQQSSTNKDSQQQKPKL